MFNNGGRRTECAVCVSMRSFAVKIHGILSGQLGIDPIRFVRSIRGLPYFLSDWFAFRRNYSGRLTLSPFLHDRFLEGGVTKSEYFWQDLLVAQWIFKDNPVKHVDVGSRIDGFVAHVASFREIEVIDIRPVSTDIPGVKFRQGDMMEESALSIETKGTGYCDSLSCLHTLEHFGLGRYGDDVDVFGYEKGIKNLSALLKVGGILYLSTPIGLERVEFNANRVFDPKTIIDAADKNRLSLQSLLVVENGQAKSVLIDPEELGKLALKKYSLGIFIFERI